MGAAFHSSIALPAQCLGVRGSTLRRGGRGENPKRGIRKEAMTEGNGKISSLDFKLNRMAPPLLLVGAWVHLSEKTDGSGIAPVADVWHFYERGYHQNQ